MRQQTPEQQEPAGKRQADDSQKLDGDQCQRDAQDDGRPRDTPEDDPGVRISLATPAAAIADDHGIVAGEHDVDEQGLEGARQNSAASMGFAQRVRPVP